MWSISSCSRFSRQFFSRFRQNNIITFTFTFSTISIPRFSFFSILFPYYYCSIYVYVYIHICIYMYILMLNTFSRFLSFNNAYLIEIIMYMENNHYCISIVISISTKYKKYTVHFEKCIFSHISTTLHYIQSTTHCHTRLVSPLPQQEVAGPHPTWITLHFAFNSALGVVIWYHTFWTKHMVAATFCRV